jgi:hypothetical protein
MFCSSSSLKPGIDRNGGGYGLDESSWTFGSISLYSDG